MVKKEVIMWFEVKKTLRLAIIFFEKVTTYKLFLKMKHYKYSLYNTFF